MQKIKGKKKMHVKFKRIQNEKEKGWLRRGRGIRFKSTKSPL
jgi:hypothetical protein